MALNKNQWLFYLQIKDYSMEEIAKIMGITIEEAEAIKKENLATMYQVEINAQKERGEW